jgi:hypothetical protein
MSAPETPDAPPPEVPEEFADAYREAYRRALEAVPNREARPDQDVLTALPELPPHEVMLVGTHRSEDGPLAASQHDWRRARWFLPAVIGASGLVLVLAAYALGTALGNDEPGTAHPSAVRSSPHHSSAASVKPPKSSPSIARGGWEGEVTPVSVDAISAGCTAPPSRDSSGRKVTYGPENAIDGETDTAWRCIGTAVGQTITLRLADEADVAEVGLIPGYAKTDPESGVDRYAENNRITRVRWTLGDGESVVQRLDPDPSSRAVQTLRVPPTTTDTVRLEILAVREGSRNATASGACAEDVTYTTSDTGTATPRSSRARR